MRVHLDNRRAGLYYDPARRVLEFNYRSGHERFLKNSLGHNIHVVGLIELQPDGEPKRIINVSELTVMNLDTVRIDKVETKDGYLVLEQPIELTPQFDGREILLEIPDLHLYSSGPTREQAIEELASDFIWLWKEYALVDDSQLSKDAIELKRRLKSMVKEARMY